MKKPSMRVEPELILFVSLLIYVKPDLTVPFLAACALHEFGHIAMLHCIKHCMNSVSMGVNGMKIYSSFLNYKQAILSALAGPAANFIGLLYHPLFPSFAHYNLVLGLYNLLPLKFLDGGTILHSLLSLYLPIDQADRLLDRITLWTASILFTIGIMLSFSHGIFPLLISGVLFIRCIRASFLV